jgi:hypothetical protein
VPRATPFTHSDVQNRSETRWAPSLAQEEAERDARIIDALARKASIPETTRERFCCEVREAIWLYREKVLAQRQERPARIVAALRQGLSRTKKLSEWLKSLSQGVRLELHAGNAERLLGDLANLLEALSTNIKGRSAYWRKHVETNRPAGQGSASLALRQSLMHFVTKHSPETSQRQIRSCVAYALNAIGAKYPNEKKNRQRFTGQPAKAAGTAKPRKQILDAGTKEARARARRLAKQFL